MKHASYVRINRSNRSSRACHLTLAVALVSLTAAARADVVLNGGNDRSSCDAGTSFGACYIGVDGSRIGTIAQQGSATFNFVGLGANSSETPAVTFPNPGATASSPSGTLELKSGSTLSISGANFNPSRPTDTALFVGLGNGSTGALHDTGGTIITPLLSIGEQDTRVSQGTVSLTSGASLTVNFDAVNAPAPSTGLTGVNIGRGAGSTGDLSLDSGSTANVSGSSVSIGRAGTGSLEVLGGSTFTTAGSIYLSTAVPSGMSSIVVNGTGSVLTVGGNILVGIETDGATVGALNLGYKTDTANHGTADLDILDGGAVHGNVVVGQGGKVHGDAFITGNLSNYGGTVSPGNSPGTIHVDGNFLMDGGLFVVEIAGTGAGQTDLVDATGTGNLANATILFSFIDGFAPTAGFTFDFVEAAMGLSTSNLTFRTQGLQDGFTFTTSTTERGGLNFLATSNGIAVVPVPEPETVALIAIGWLATLGATRRRRSRRG